MSAYEKFKLEGDLIVSANVGPKPIMLGADMVERLKVVRVMDSPTEQAPAIENVVTSAEEPKQEPVAAEPKPMFADVSAEANKTLAPLETPVVNDPAVATESVDELNPQTSLEKVVEALTIALEIANKELDKTKKTVLDEEQIQKIA